MDKTALTLPEPRRVRDRVQYVAKQPCLVCGRQHSDAHRFLRTAASRVSDEFTAFLCRGIIARRPYGAGIDPIVSARSIWLNTHPLRQL
jgi:hypothetical protein